MAQQQGHLLDELLAHELFVFARAGRGHEALEIHEQCANQRRVPSNGKHSQPPLDSVMARSAVVMDAA